jgi:hypothetical protein
MSNKHKRSVINQTADFSLRNDMSQLSFASYESDSLNNFNDHETNDLNEIRIYERLCYDLRIVPCSIIVKSLPTTSIVLSNYGLNSTGILALANTLKVFQLYLIMFLIDKY